MSILVLLLVSALPSTVFAKHTHGDILRFAHQGADTNGDQMLDRREAQSLAQELYEHIIDTVKHDTVDKETFIQTSMEKRLKRKCSFRHWKKCLESKGDDAGTARHVAHERHKQRLRNKLNRLFEHLDFNSDGLLSLDDIQNMTNQHFDAADKDNNELLSDHEISTFRRALKAQRRTERRARHFDKWIRTATTHSAGKNFSDNSTRVGCLTSKSMLYAVGWLDLMVQFGLGKNPPTHC